jgi:ELP3 family radical SAM enzyme/protein acetyltransferase
MELETIVPTAPAPHLTEAIKYLLNQPPSAYDTPAAFGRTTLHLARVYRTMLNKRELWATYSALNTTDPVRYPMRTSLRLSLLKKAVRSASGIVNVSVVMPGSKFSCKYNCRFCPSETVANGAAADMPRSYLSNEDAVQRAASVGFDAGRQANIRFAALESNGHPIDKIEFRILGGTFSCYPHDVATTFIRDLYYAANTYYDDDPRRDPLSLEEEIAANASTRVHVVGVGVETRPDEITPAEIARFRRYGITRVELGVQHTNDELLRRVNRGHGVKASKTAIRLLKDAAFKIEMHIMADLPGATPDLDKACYAAVLRDDPDLIPDYLKDYPCLDVAYTEIKAWKADGRWTPYAERDGGALLHDVLIYRQQITPPWVRVNRIQRDFRPAAAANCGLGFTSDTLHTDLGDRVSRLAEARGIYCQCIRCCEVRTASYDATEIQFRTRRFTASGATEYFLSVEVDRPHRPLLLGFLRLRLSEITATSPIPELRGRTALIRELHVYGTVCPVGEQADTATAQHRGLGTELLRRAEQISRVSAFDRIAIIAGVGVRNYYRRFGYELIGTYMIKSIQRPLWIPRLYLIASIILAVYSVTRILLKYQE